MDIPHSINQQPHSHVSMASLGRKHVYSFPHHQNHHSPWNQGNQYLLKMLVTWTFRQVFVWSDNKFSRKLKKCETPRGTNSCIAVIWESLLWPWVSKGSWVNRDHGSRVRQGQKVAVTSFFQNAKFWLFNHLSIPLLLRPYLRKI